MSGCGIIHWTTVFCLPIFHLPLIPPPWSLGCSYLPISSVAPARMGTQPSVHYWGESNGNALCVGNGADVRQGQDATSWVACRLSYQVMPTRLMLIIMLLLYLLHTASLHKASKYLPSPPIDKGLFTRLMAWNCPLGNTRIWIQIPSIYVQSRFGSIHLDHWAEIG